MMKIILPLVCICSVMRSTAQVLGSKKQLASLKEYAVSSCIHQVFARERIDIQKDISPAIYFEQLPYAPEAFKLLDSIAGITVNRIQPLTVPADFAGRLSVIKGCFSLYYDKRIIAIMPKLQKLKQETRW